MPNGLGSLYMWVQGWLWICLKLTERTYFRIFIDEKRIFIDENHIFINENM
jgi:hypothetical protein